MSERNRWGLIGLAAVVFTLAFALGRVTGPQSAAGQLPNKAEERREMIAELKETNSRLGRIEDVLKRIEVQSKPKKSDPPGPEKP
ncbi:MAG: hypothetical protein KDA32_10385 [Phycisphaerales bacterium]|nr:hypothetical protein [Phycisphaerales bacterium]